MRQFQFRTTAQFRDNAAGQYFAQFDAPLVEAVDVPDRPLRKDAVLVQRDQAAECRRVRRSASITLVGRLPSVTRNGAW